MLVFKGSNGVVYGCASDTEWQASTDGVGGTECRVFECLPTLGVLPPALAKDKASVLTTRIVVNTKARSIAKGITIGPG